ncbi:MAG: YbaB/EbfC family nucleoid-associated protein [Alphaproteobacteria bacterium]|nr:YbaB/EbfC family nucleoid-associated protein [Alphaproteobacteria bacterium]MDX5415352.1 YbaB/EbfC family nucleoid-associated protein [Alphaproteobacteria bacterium]MDX5492567.1 YbaB/EbfC family nucleoid-associated protein [Alphaproteobacteria bacterium]
MKNMFDIMKQAQQLQSRMASMQQELEAAEVEGRAGGGMVTIVMSGKGEVKKVAIDPSLMKEDEREILEDLIVAACADAKSKAEQLAAEKMKSVAGGLPLPPGLGL